MRRFFTLVVLVTSVYSQRTSPAWSQSWTSADMLHARAEHTLTVLNDGRVLSLGGFVQFSGPTVLADTYELFDERSLTWTEATVPPSVLQRARHTATVLDDGRVLVTGGFVNLSEITTNQCDIYDPGTDTWTATAQLAEARQFHRAVKLDDGSVLVVGGGKTLTERFDPMTETWATAGQLSVPRYYNTATLLPDGRVLVVGGIYLGSSTFVGSETTEIFDPTAPASSAWTVLTTDEPGYRATIVPRQDHFAFMLSDGDVLLVGGHNSTNVLALVDRFDFEVEAWQEVGPPSLQIPRLFPTATVLGAGDQILLAGGTIVDDSVTPPVGILTTATELSSPSGSWSPTAEAVTARWWAESVTLPSGRVLVSGGYAEFPFGFISAAAELYTGRSAGDLNDDGTYDLADVIALLGALFPAGISTPLPPLEEADLNGDGAIDIGDPVFYLSYLFGGGASPPFVP